MGTIIELLLNWRFWALMSPVVFMMVFALVGGICIELQEFFSKERDW